MASETQRRRAAEQQEGQEQAPTMYRKSKYAQKLENRAAALDDTSLGHEATERRPKIGDQVSGKIVLCRDEKEDGRYYFLSVEGLQDAVYVNQDEFSGEHSRAYQKGEWIVFTLKLPTKGNRRMRGTNARPAIRRKN